MTRTPSTVTQAACLLLSVGFIGGTFVASCTRQHAKTAVEFFEAACEVVPDLDDRAKEVCVTEDELKNAVRDIVSSRKAAGGQSGPGVAVVKLP